MTDASKREARAMHRAIAGMAAWADSMGLDRRKRKRLARKAGEAAVEDLEELEAVVIDALEARLDRIVSECANGRPINGGDLEDIAEAIDLIKSMTSAIRIGFYPPLMVNPMAGDNRRAADARLFTSYCVQQSFVPDQTALVFRADLLTWQHELWRLRALVKHLSAGRAPPPEGGE